jgi:DNA-binding NarL/FixJ family response regulator
MKVLCVDDHTLFRKGLVALLETDARFEVVADLANAPDAIEWLGKNTVDLVVVDLALNQGSGLDLLASIRQLRPGQRTVVLTMFTHRTMESKARALGAYDYICKDVPPAQLCERLAASLTAPAQTPADTSKHQDPIEALTHRQLDIFRLLGRGLTTREVADQLMLSPKTVESHRLKIKELLKVKHVGELVALSARVFPEG